MYIIYYKQSCKISENELFEERANLTGNLHGYTIVEHEELIKN